MATKPWVGALVKPTNGNLQFNLSPLPSQSGTDQKP
jgi:hypothetical protein